LMNDMEDHIGSSPKLFDEVFLFVDETVSNSHAPYGGLLSTALKDRPTQKEAHESKTGPH